MQAYASRDVAARGRHVPQDFLQSIFICEMLVPSNPLWIVSPWISDVELLDNSARQFSTLEPDWPVGPIRLLEIIAAMLERGGSVRILANEDPHNREFASRLQHLVERYPKQLELRHEGTLHAKGIIGERFAVEGSMNLTYSGVYRNDEHLTYRTDPRQVQERRLTLSRLWGDVQ